jgi:nicotinamide-nucleotide amidase
MASSSSTVSAALVTVGDELLLGRTVDTNGAWLGRALGTIGIPVVRRLTVGDDEAEIRQAVADAMAVGDVVIVTGGLGPTPDDVTRDAIAGLLGVPLREDPEVLESIRVRFRDRGVEELPHPNRRVAQVPEGARKLANAVGTAPGLVFEVDGGLVVLLPGVPREMRGIFTDGLESLLQQRFRDRLEPIWMRSVHTTGIPESLLSEQIAERLPEGPAPLGLAFLPKVHGVALRFTGVGISEEEAEGRFDEIARSLAPVLDPWSFEAEDGDLAAAVSQALRRSGSRLAVAESCTGGLIAKRLVDVPGASDVLVGAVVAYSNEVKRELLAVPPRVLEEQGAVSEAVARQMAVGVAKALGAEAGIGITGVAGPGGGTDEKPVGTVWYAASAQGRVVAQVQRFAGDREGIRERSAQAALFLLLRLLDGRLGQEAQGRD